MRGLAAVLALSVLMTACTSDQVTGTLEAAVDAAIAADSIARPQDQPYLTLATGCMDAAASELESSDAPAIKASKIGLACSQVVSASQGAPIGVQAVVAALNTFLRTVESTKTAYQFSSPAMVSAFNASPAAKVSTSRLKRIRKKLKKLRKH